MGVQHNGYPFLLTKQKTVNSAGLTNTTSIGIEKHVVFLRSVSTFAPNNLVLLKSVKCRFLSNTISGKFERGDGAIKFAVVEKYLT